MAETSAASRSGDDDGLVMTLVLRPWIAARLQIFADGLHEDPADIVLDAIALHLDELERPPDGPAVTA
jgi:hypothetical protein